MIRVVLAVALVALGCAAETPPPATNPREVSLPPWASAPTTAAPKPATTAPISLGTDDAKPKLSSKKRIDLDVVGADLGNVCRLIGELAGVNIVVADGVTGNVTIKLKSVPWDEALDAILASKGYRAERLGSVVVVRK